MKLKIKVTKEVLKATMMCGINSKPVKENCAVAFAVRDIFPKAAVTDVIRPFGGGTFPLIFLPDIARHFITAFDDAGMPEIRQYIPGIEFEINVPDSVIQRINISNLDEVIAKSETLELV